jgi:hypothetical protein
MKVSTILLLLATAVFGSAPASQYPDAEWKHKIILFQSTRADVEKLLGKPIGESYGVTYKLKDGILYLTYYDFDHCKSRYGFDADWNLPEWTVTEIVYRPNRLPKFSNFHLNLDKLHKARLNPETPSVMSYIDDLEGVEYAVESDGRLNSVRYFPGSRFDGFRCAK